MREMGLFGLTIPEEFGGLGETLLTYALVVEELSRGWMSISGINTHFIVAYLVSQHGSAGQRAALAPNGPAVLAHVVNLMRTATSAPTYALPGHQAVASSGGAQNQRQMSAPGFSWHINRHQRVTWCGSHCPNLSAVVHVDVRAPAAPVDDSGRVAAAN